MVRNPFAAVGATTLRIVDEFGKIGIFAGQTVRHVFTPPVRTRLFVKEVYKLGVLSLTIVMISGFAVGSFGPIESMASIEDIGPTFGVILSELCEQYVLGFYAHRGSARRLLAARPSCA